MGETGDDRRGGGADRSLHQQGTTANLASAPDWKIVECISTFGTTERWGVRDGVGRRGETVTTTDCSKGRNDCNKGGGGNEEDMGIAHTISGAGVAGEG